MPEKFFRGSEQNRPAGRVQPSGLADQAVLKQAVDRMVTAHPSDLFDLRSGYRLLVGYDRERLHHDIRQADLPWLPDQTDQGRILLLLGRELVTSLQLYDPDSALGSLILLCHFLQDREDLLLSDLQSPGDRFRVNGVPHGKQDRLQSGFERGFITAHLTGPLLHGHQFPVSLLNLQLSHPRLPPFPADRIPPTIHS